MEENKTQTSNAAILGINLAVFAGYTILGWLAGQEAVVFVFFLAIVHGFAALIIALIQRRWIWALAGLLIPLIGFGTCLNNIKLGHM
jgi:Zn-dependent protease with chaperone function